VCLMSGTNYYSICCKSKCTCPHCKSFSVAIGRESL
jgi:hypothetical protein